MAVRVPRSSLSLCLVLWFGCESAPLDAPDSQNIDRTTMPNAALDANDAGATRDAGATSEADPCAAIGSSLDAAPQTVTDMVDHINTLPNPVTLPCLIKSLSRPLQIHATRSILSAQPAVGQRSPRIFIFSDQLILSIALAGMGKDLLEFGERRPEARTLKAEIEFPVAGELSHAAPFERIVYKEGQSSCAFCHSAESPDDTIDFADAFVSTAYRPARNQDYVSVAELARELSECDPEVEPQRCDMLESLFSGGVPVEQEFPAEFRTFQ